MNIQENKKIIESLRKEISKRNDQIIGLLTFNLEIERISVITYNGIDRIYFHIKNANSLTYPFQEPLCLSCEFSCDKTDQFLDNFKNIPISRIKVG